MNNENVQMSKEEEESRQEMYNKMMERLAEMSNTASEPNFNRNKSISYRRHKKYVLRDRRAKKKRAKKARQKQRRRAKGLKDI